MKRSSFLSHSNRKNILNNEYTQNYTPRYTCYYIVNKEKKTRLKITNQKYATYLHRLLDDDFPSLRKSQRLILKNSQKFSRNRKNNNSISKTVNSTNFSTPSKKETKIQNLKIKIFPKKSYSKQKIKILSTSNKNTKYTESKKFDFNRHEKILQKFYEYDKTFSKIKNLIKRKKSLDLKKYQDNFVKLSQNHLSKNNMMRFISELNEIRKSAEMIKPLPPINLPALIINSLKENENKEKKDVENKRYAEAEKYEKEMYKIRQSNKKRSVLFRRNENKALFKSYNCFPEYIVNTPKKSIK